MKHSITKDKKRSMHQLWVLIFWILIWQLIHLIVGRDIYVPSPFQVFMRLREMVFLSMFWKVISYSIYRVMAGILLSVVLGVVMGVISSMNKYVYDILHPLVVAIRSTPVMSFIIIALIWFSSSNVPIFICFLMCFPIIWTNVIEGIRNVDGGLLEMAKVYNIKRWLVLTKIYVPSISPYLFAACITSLGLAWKVSVAAEVLSHPRNAIGSELYSAKVYLDSSQLFAWTLVVIILSLLFENIFVRFVKKRIIEV